MWAVILDVIVLTLGTAAFLDMAMGFASGLLMLAHADQASAPHLFWRCIAGEAVLIVGAVGWFSFAATL